LLSTLAAARAATSSAAVGDCDVCGEFGFSTCLSPSVYVCMYVCLGLGLCVCWIAVSVSMSMAMPMPMSMPGCEWVRVFGAAGVMALCPRRPLWRYEQRNVYGAIQKPCEAEAAALATQRQCRRRPVSNSFQALRLVAHIHAYTQHSQTHTHTHTHTETCMSEFTRKYAVNSLMSLSTQAARRWQ